MLREETLQRALHEIDDLGEEEVALRTRQADHHTAHRVVAGQARGAAEQLAQAERVVVFRPGEGEEFQMPDQF